jgi:hypothetical protein
MEGDAMSGARTVVGMLGVSVLGLQVWTQWLARHYGYHALLGQAWWQHQLFSRQVKAYAPWKALVWTWQWGTPRTVFLMVLGCALVVVVGLLVCWRHEGHGQQEGHPPPMTGHGSGQWATARDIRKAKLF